MCYAIRFLCLLVPALSFAAANPFIGHWDFDVSTPNGVGANWLGISDNNGKTEIWFQPTGGNVFQVENFTLNNSQLTLHPTAGETWQLKAENGELTGTKTHNGQTVDVTGRRAPALDREAPAAWASPVALFNGHNLDGWEPIGPPANNHWVVQDGDMVNLQHGDNLRTVQTFNDFKLHFEVNCPDDGNSGFYLRGRYEVQIEAEPVSKNPPNRRIGSIYGRIAPATELPRRADEWDSFDVTLVGRTVTIVRNGVTLIDHKKIEGITGGALNADEGEPGPFYIQGDHTGGIHFRNITVSVPR